MAEAIRAHDTLLWLLAAASVVTFFATMIGAVWLVVRIPSDYFTERKRGRTLWANQHPVVRVLLLIGKNGLGYVFVAAGLAMLLLPGQGLLTIVAGVALLDFPGKYRLQRWLVTRRRVFGSINWLRQRAGRPPLELHT